MIKNNIDFIDNLDGNTLTAALRLLLGANSDDSAILVEETVQVDEARIATAYFSPEGFARIATAIAPVAPEIMPLRPPKIEVIKPTKNAA